MTVIERAVRFANMLNAICMCEVWCNKHKLLVVEDATARSAAAQMSCAPATLRGCVAHCQGVRTLASGVTNERRRGGGAVPCLPTPPRRVSRWASHARSSPRLPVE